MGASTVPDAGSAASSSAEITYRQYKDEHDLPLVMDLIDRELSEPYSIFTYRYFLNQWPQLCYLAFAGGAACGVVVCKMDQHRERMRGYLAMLVVDHAYRGKGMGITLARMAISAMAAGGCEEVVLEAEVTNSGALALYRRLGFMRDKRLHKYYLSGSDAYRLKLLLPVASELIQKRLQEAMMEAAAAAPPAPGSDHPGSESDERSAADSMILLSRSQVLAEQQAGQQQLQQQLKQQQGAACELEPRMSISSDDFVIVKN